jgi:alpha-1,3-mannosyltransferase
MLFLYGSIYCLIKQNRIVACLLFSLGVSIKMNILLFAPGLFVLLVLSSGLIKTIFYILFCAVVQLVVGAPFLFTFPLAYIHRSFDIGRQFFYIWTVNWKCLPEDVFKQKYFQITLLGLHLFVLIAFVNKSLKFVLLN